MKQLLFDTGGRPLANDDLDTLQQETFAALTAYLQDAPPLVLSGCQVQARANDVGTITAGLLWLAGQIHRYAGASGVSLPAEIVLGEVEVLDERAYQTGGTKACITERQLVTQAHSVANQVPKVVINAAPELTYSKWLESRQRTVGEIQWLANVRPEDYDMTGRGWPDLLSRGWALCNGQNGTADLRGRFVAGQNPDRPDYDTIGKTGGLESVTLTAAEMPAHTHTATVDGAGNDRSVNYGAFGALQNGKGSGQTAKKATTDSAGGGQPHENRPPFYVLAARQWIGL